MLQSDEFISRDSRGVITSCPSFDLLQILKILQETKHRWVPLQIKNQVSEIRQFT